MVGASRCLFACLILLGWTLAASAQTIGSGLPTEAQLNRLGLTRAWWGYSVTNIRRDKVLFITLDETNLYVQSSNGVITAFDAETGRRLWAVQAGPSDQTTFPAVSAPDFVFCVNGMKLYAIRKQLGEIAWEIDLPGTPSTSPSTARVEAAVGAGSAGARARDIKLLFIGMLDGSIYGFNYQTLLELSEQGRMNMAHTSKVFRFKTSQAITGPAVTSRHLVAFGSESGQVYTMAPELRSMSYRFSTSGLSAPLARYSDLLLIPSEDFNLYAINFVNGRKAWEFPSGSPIRQSPVVIGSDLYLLPERAAMYRINAATGKLVWPRPVPGVTQFLSQSVDGLYVMEGRNLVALNLSDGNLRGRMSMYNFTVNLSNQRNDRIYMSTPNGLLVCLRETSLAFPAPHEGLDLMPLAPDFVPEGDLAPAAPAADANAADTAAETETNN